jgi:hypothetical protein
MTTNVAVTASRPWRRFLRFGVRGTIVLLVVIGCGLGWYVRIAHTQHEAVVSLRNAKAFVAYKGDRTKGPLFEDEKPRVLKRLEDVLGVDYFNQVKREGGTRF